MSDLLVIAGRGFRSRLIVGTGKYRSHQEMVRAHEASGAEMVTVAVRRVNLTDRTKESLLDYIDRKKFFILPNTAGCYTADEAIRTARLGREVGLSEWVKLEVIGDQQTLFPDTEELIKATRILAHIKSLKSFAPAASPAEPPMKRSPTRPCVLKNRAKLVVMRAFFLITEYLVCFVQFLEFLLISALFIGMMLMRQFSVCFFYILF